MLVMSLSRSEAAELPLVNTFIFGVLEKDTGSQSEPMPIYSEVNSTKVNGDYSQLSLQRITIFLSFSFQKNSSLNKRFTDNKLC